MTDAAVAIRAASAEDAPEIAAVVRAAFEEHRRLEPTSGALAETEENVRALLASIRVAVAIAGGAIVGSVYETPRGDHLYVSRLAVLPRARRRGAGRALMADAESFARRLGLARIELGVRLALPELRAWYERQGYRLVGLNTHPGFASPTYATLAKPITGGAPRTTRP